MVIKFIFGLRIFGHKDAFGHQDIFTKSERRKTTYSSVRPRELKLITWSINETIITLYITKDPSKIFINMFE